MLDTNQFNLDKDTIDQLGILRCYKNINAQIAPNARVFEYPNIENVYIMESDLYGNTMPKGSCFLAFEGRAGLMGIHITIATLRNSSIEDIRKLVEDNHAG
ncbi:hypothetical protein OCK74_27710 [Chitinophagaceae bacterium LB-8]|jgi:hypothetical protein|uniref:Uncharacterized protein n=1 Tax=Paraflavisolibacter caeni TaxID=2982496 RepID=A0A9X2Y1K9_9BACT|nr:hypothetical protein [Paraflavisolibacter caeni]MCU7552932.1 hypothetical protein [Paraflavisolibacter caeni]